MRMVGISRFTASHMGGSDSRGIRHAFSLKRRSRALNETNQREEINTKRAKEIEKKQRR